MSAPELLHGDNLRAMQALLDRGLGGKVALVYADPPFFTGDTFTTRSGAVAYQDPAKDLDRYLAGLAKRLIEIRELLSLEGSLVLHLDHHAVHDVKLVCDAVFGRANFASEIIWRYRKWPTKTRNLQRVHDTLLRYRKDMSVVPRFTQHYEPLSPSTLAQWGTKKQRAVVANGERTRSSSADEQSPGAPLGDVWEIGIVGPSSKERTGYPTQKPELLLERIVGIWSGPGDLVLDPYMGSGTTLVVCERMGRRCIGIDESDEAIRTTTERLAANLAASVPEQLAIKEAAE